MKNWLPHHGELFYEENFFSEEKSKDFHNRLLTEVAWEQQYIRLFGKKIKQPRLTAWTGEAGIAYTYSGLRSIAGGWLPLLEELQERVEEKTGVTFNSALLNLYRSGADSMGWHRDNEKDLGKDQEIVSLSFGATRRFDVREYKLKNDLISFDLSSGSLLIMKGEMQSYWEHRVPKLKEECGPRVNITFRKIR